MKHTIIFLSAIAFLFPLSSCEEGFTSNRKRCEAKLKAATVLCKISRENPKCAKEDDCWPLKKLLKVGGCE